MSEQHSKNYDSRLVTLDEQICALCSNEKSNQLILQAFHRMKPFQNGQSNMDLMTLFSDVLPID